jgi:nucleotide-binding universal stress UspA family protein
VYSRILVPLDGSTFGEAALSRALALSKRTGAALHLVSVVEPIPALPDDPWEEKAKEWSEDYLEEVAERVSVQTGQEVTKGVRSGLVVEAILTEASSCGADLIVMATHGRGALSRAWLGSVADGVMRHAKVPVFLVRPKADEAPVLEPTLGFHTILVPLDGSELSECALDYATELGELFGSAYHLTRVVAYPLDIASPYVPYTVQMNQNIVTEAKAAAAEYLETQAERLRWRGLAVTTSVAVDAQPGRGILSEAEAVGCDLIAMATHGRSGVGRLVLGSAADRVLRGARVPLLLYRPSNVPAVKL